MDYKFIVLLGSASPMSSEHTNSPQPSSPEPSEHDRTDLPSSQPEGAGAKTQEIDQWIEHAQQQLQDLKARHQKYQAARQQHQTLQEQAKSHSEGQPPDPEQTVLQESIEKIEFEIASDLIDWIGQEYLSFKYPGEQFWQFFRYAGIGFMVAIALHALL
jgi:hypothetical protein